ncbi:hypothetical protein EX30DRAFT_365835 [Ascodesmis nigricans]|uniref:SET domain-containing protein n=1 Tax=Ascodesmis nigricans TaxID=341454 RepID=A0A4S2MNH9_9PEZI|nr:hypothetical protein EX30DRAFT_365835 [Ascodesmis nigricans]
MSSPPLLKPSRLLTHLQTLSTALDTTPYHPALYLDRAATHLSLSLPDLAAGDAYRALLLLDYVADYIDAGDLSVGGSSDGESSGDDTAEDTGDDDDDEEGDDDPTERDADGERVDKLELHAAAMALRCILDDLCATDSDISESVVLMHVSDLASQTMVLLVKSLESTACYHEARSYIRLAFRRFGDAVKPQLGAVLDRVEKRLETAEARESGTAFRVRYPWNEFEPDRFAEETVRFINETFVPKASPGNAVEVKVLELPVLSRNGEDRGRVKQLGMFAARDLRAGEVVLEEASALTTVADVTGGGLCECCSRRYREVEMPSKPSLSLDPAVKKSKPQNTTTSSSSSPKIDTITCESCRAAESAGIDCPIPTWCLSCHSTTTPRYHPILCARPTAPFHRAATSPSPPPHTTPTPNGPLYSLLLLKTFALALSPSSPTHPLNLPETKYLYGVSSTPLPTPWSFRDHVLTPLAILDALGVDAFSGRDPRGAGERGWWEPWVVNTLVAKYRGVASGRMGVMKGGVGTEAVGCQVVYSMANHDCAPRVGWELEERMRFRVLGREGQGGEGQGKMEGGAGKEGGEGEIVVRKGEEVTQCYCDRSLDVAERREWMMGVLGGLCKCARCVRESGETVVGESAA